MNYEAMFLIRPDLNENDQKSLIQKIKDAIIKNKGSVVTDAIWAEKKKLAYSIKPKGSPTRYFDGTYVLIHFASDPSGVNELKKACKLMEEIIRVLILKIETK